MPGLRSRCHPILIAYVAIMSGVWPTAAPAAGDHALGEYLSAECVTCHKLTGRQEGIPTIVGLSEAQFIDFLNAYRMKKRDNIVMQNIAARLSDGDIAALASYFSSLKATPRAR